MAKGNNAQRKQVKKPKKQRRNNLKNPPRLTQGIF